MAKVRLGSPKSLSAIEPGLVDPVHEIPAAKKEGVEKIDLSVLDGWGELKVEQQRYLVQFSLSHLKEKRAALAVGVTTAKLRDWKNSDGLFINIFNDIIDIHTEGVEEVDYLASYSPSNNTSRGRFLNNRSKLYNKDENGAPNVPKIGTQNNQTNILNILNSDDVLDKGLAGVQKMFNNLKEQGALPVQDE